MKKNQIIGIALGLVLVNLGCGRVLESDGSKSTVSAATIMSVSSAEASLKAAGMDVYTTAPNGDLSKMTARYNSNYLPSSNPNADANLRAAIKNYIQVAGAAINGVDLNEHPELLEVMWKLYAVELYQYF